MKTRKQAVDLTDLAIGVIILGIVVSIGASVLITLRDSRLTDLDAISTVNETLTTVAGVNGEALTNVWVQGLSFCSNATGAETIPSNNYTLTINSVNGQGTVTPVVSSLYNNSNWNCSYTWYNTSRSDWKLANESAGGLAEYGNWFKIIVIVGVAAVVLSLIFLAFGRSASGSGGEGIY